MKKYYNPKTNQIFIYKFILFERIFTILSGVFLLIIPIYPLVAKKYESEKELLQIIITSLILITYIVFVYFMSYKSFICLDKNRNMIVVRDFLCGKKEELSLYGVSDVRVTSDPKCKSIFTFDINYIGYTKKITSWSLGRRSTTFFSSNRNQKRRLTEFAKECNEYIMMKNKKNEGE